MARHVDEDDRPERPVRVDVLAGLIDSQPNEPKELDEHYELNRRIVEGLVDGRGSYTDTHYNVAVDLRANGRQVYAHFEDDGGPHTIPLEHLGLPQMRRAAVALNVDLDDVRTSLAA